MPEGDSVYRLAVRLREALDGGIVASGDRLEDQADRYHAATLKRPPPPDDRRPAELH